MKATGVPSLDPERVALIEDFGGRIEELDPIGAAVSGIDLSADVPPPTEVTDALELEMAHRGFIVFRSDEQLEPDAFLRASCWWGGKMLHSTHGVHPATPGQNRHIFRLSNDPHHGIQGWARSGTTTEASSPRRSRTPATTSSGRRRGAAEHPSRTRALRTMRSPPIARSTGVVWHR